jgi:hypothetical protein
MAQGDQKASGKRPLGPPSVRIIGAAEAARIFGGGGPALPAREPAPDESGKIVGGPQPPAA